MDYEPLTFAEKKIKDDVDKMFGDGNHAMKAIVLYTKLLDLYPDDAELKSKIDSTINKIRNHNRVAVENINAELTCTLDASGNIVSLDTIDGIDLQEPI